MGWYMVSSGLIDAPHVSHFRLTIHLLIALTLLAIALWTALSRSYAALDGGQTRWSRFGIAVLAIIVLQIAYGGLVAGLKAGKVSNTWPLMGGALVPPGLLSSAGGWLESLLEGPATVHFIHRWLAFVVLAFAVWLYVRHGGRQTKTARQLRAGAVALLAIVVVQIVLGISVVLFGVPIWLALLHQATALVMFATAVYLNHRLARGG
jgi:cytochrome c oxidase assembly protein subunit 15